jgi:retron-type reverse transcriptase
VARILHAIYEADFPACSYGYRPGRNPHQALAEIRRIILTEPIQWIYEADIRSFFDNLDHEWLMKMVELRVGDPWILRLIRKWPGVGIFDNGTVVRPEKGTPQGGPLSPVLANIYLHYVLDLWFERAFKQTCYGKAFLIRFADVYIHYKGYPIPPSEETVRMSVRDLPSRGSLRECPEKSIDDLHLMALPLLRESVSSFAGSPRSPYTFEGLRLEGASSYD